MPNVKIYADEALVADHGPALRAALSGLRDVLCAALKVGPEACQIALLPVAGLPGQPTVNVELLILPGPDRDRAVIGSLAAKLQQVFAAVPGARAAVRIGMLDPQTYVAIK